LICVVRISPDFSLLQNNRRFRRNKASIGNSRGQMLKRIHKEIGIRGLEEPAANGQGKDEGFTQTQGLQTAKREDEVMNGKRKLLSLAFAFAALPCSGAFAAEGTCSVSLTQDPLVMRLGKDEFRIAFGLDAKSCMESGCTGTIRYNATWETEDGTRNTEQKTVTFNIPENAERSLSVDRSYFDTAEAQHQTNIVAVDVNQISCDGTPKTGLASR
jgi:hypothetical protein